MPRVRHLHHQHRPRRPCGRSDAEHPVTTRSPARAGGRSTPSRGSPPREGAAPRRRVEGRAGSAARRCSSGNARRRASARAVPSRPRRGIRPYSPAARVEPVACSTHTSRTSPVPGAKLTRFIIVAQLRAAVVADAPTVLREGRSPSSGRGLPRRRASTRRAPGGRRRARGRWGASARASPTSRASRGHHARRAEGLERGRRGVDRTTAAARASPGPTRAPQPAQRAAAVNSPRSEGQAGRRVERHRRAAPGHAKVAASTSASRHDTPSPRQRASRQALPAGCATETTAPQRQRALTSRSPRRRGRARP